MTDAELAVVDIAEAYEEYGSNIILIKSTNEIRDRRGILITPATVLNIPKKAMIGTFATDKLLKKLTSDQLKSYSLSVRFQTTEDLNDIDYKIKFLNSTYNIFLIDKKILQNTILKYEVLLKR